MSGLLLGRMGQSVDSGADQIAVCLFCCCWIGLRGGRLFCLLLFSGVKSRVCAGDGHALCCAALSRWRVQYHIMTLAPSYSQ